MLSQVLISLGIILGTGLFLVGTIGLLHLPDTYTRIHALLKTHHLGVGLIILSLAGYAGDLLITLELLVIWGFIVCGNVLSSHFILRSLAQHDVTLWRRDLE